MTWLVLAAAVAVSYGAQGAVSKKLLARYSDAWVRWMLFLVAAPLLALYLVVRGVPHVAPAFWPVLAVAAVGGALSFWLYMRAIHLTDLSIAFPLISLTPLFMVPVELALLGDLPGLQGFAGVLAIVVGVYVLNLRSDHGSLLDPLRAVADDRGALLALALAALWAVTGVIDKVAIRYSSPALYAPAVTAAIALLFAPAALRARAQRTVLRDASSGDEAGHEEAGAHVGLFALQGVLFAVMYVAQLEAVRLTLVSYVIGIKRTGTILSVVLGYLLFEEREFGYRLAGAVVIVAGILLLALG